ncbi:hypothetical protein PC116_g13970 [Phytophthora cactorum]|nr:hypothetical protein PC116_g13970 [Phytophthora cactorum]
MENQAGHVAHVYQPRSRRERQVHHHFFHASLDATVGERDLDGDP